jgi:hypothetical protein
MASGGTFEIVVLSAFERPEKGEQTDKSRPSAKGTTITSSSITVRFCASRAKRVQHDKQRRAGHRRRRNQESYNSADRHWYRLKVVSDGKRESSAASPCTKIDRRDHRSKRLAKKTDPLWPG